MDDPHDLVYRASIWNIDAAELDKIMADMSTLSQANKWIVSNVARKLLCKASTGKLVLNEYQAAICNVYAVRGYNVHECEKALDRIRQASFHLETLREASKPFTTALGMEEHHQVTELAATIEKLRSFWQSIEPKEPPWVREYRAPSLEKAQSLLDLAKGPGSKAWGCVDRLGRCHIYSTKPLWTVGGPTAAGLLRDPSFKLPHFLYKPRLPGGKGLDSAKLWSEVVRCNEIWDGLDHEARVTLLAVRFVNQSSAFCKARGIVDS